MNTHSGALDDDLTRTATLVDAAGKQEAALGWDGDPAGGHHRKAAALQAMRDQFHSRGRNTAPAAHQAMLSLRQSRREVQRLRAHGNSNRLTGHGW